MQYCAALRSGTFAWLCRHRETAAAAARCSSKRTHRSPSGPESPAPGPVMGAMSKSRGGLPACLLSQRCDSPSHWLAHTD
ncbi:unnamed protein product [Lota lota]